MLVLFALGGAYAAHSRKSNLDTTTAALATALQDASRQKSLVDFLTDRASAAEARADAEAAKADLLAKVSRRSEIRYAEAKAVAPDTCDDVIFAADSALAAAQAEAEMADAARRDALDAAKDYRAGKDSALAALARLRVAGEAVEASAKPSLLERLRPRLTAGVTAGVNPITERPAVVIGVGLGWSF